MSDTSSSSDIENIVMDIFEDDLDVVGNIQHAACVVGVTNTECGRAQYRGRMKGSRNINRRPCSWFKDYLSLNPVYSAAQFRKVFHIPIKLYWKLHEELLEEESSFINQQDASGRLRHSSHQKHLCCIRWLSDGLSFE